MYKPGSLGQAPPMLTPHQPRLDWQMWFAALGPHTQAPWFSSLMYRILQGKSDGTYVCSLTPQSPPTVLGLKVRSVVCCQTCHLRILAGSYSRGLYGIKPRTFFLRGLLKGITHYYQTGKLI